MKRFEAYFDDVMAGRRGNGWIGFGLMLLAICTGGAIVVALPVVAYLLLH